MDFGNPLQGLRLFPDRGTILIKTLLDIIEDHESQIIKFEKSLEQKLRLKITKTSKNKGKIRRGRGNLIAYGEIAKILGVKYKALEKWLTKIKKGEENNLDFSSVSQVKAHLKLFSELPSVYRSFLRAFTRYNNFIDEIFERFIEYIDIPLHKISGKWLSLVLKKNDHYISKFSRDLLRIKKYEKYTKYIEFLVSIHLIEEYDLKYPLKKGRTLSDLKKESHDFIFQILKDLKFIRDLSMDSMSPRFGKRILKKQINEDNHELFDIIIHSLVALSKVQRKKNPEDTKYIFPYIELSMKVSRNKDENFFTRKLKRGFPLARIQGNRLIKFLRKNLHDSPQDCHDTIYEIRKHIVNTKKIWYWNKYDIHFNDLYIPQIKSLFDVTLGLNLLCNEFLSDGYEKVTKSGYVIKGVYVLELPRHHLEEDEGYLILEQSKDGKSKFKLLPLDSDSHNYIHTLKIIEYQENTDVINTRLLHLYELINRPPNEGVTLEYFRNDDYKAIWGKFSNDILIEWIKRWEDYKASEEEFYRQYYPNFYEKIYIPFMKDHELYKAKDPNCKFPEFWFWYPNYLEEELLFYDQNNL